MYIDDRRVGSTTIALSSLSRIEGMLGSQGGLYIGGVPQGVDVRNMAASLDSLKGCLSDLIVNSKYVFKLLLLKSIHTERLCLHLRLFSLMFAAT